MNPAAPSRLRAVSRYDQAGAPPPPNGVATPPRSRNISVALVAVQDPYAVRHRLLATVNRKVDVLEMDRSKELITEAAYQTGRIVQAIFDRAAGVSGGGQWREGDRVDADFAHELAIVRQIDRAKDINAVLVRIVHVIGRIDTRLLRSVLGDGLSYAQAAAARGRAGDRGTAYYAARFRDALETIAEAWAARGKGGGGIRTWFAGGDPPAPT